MFKWSLFQGVILSVFIGGLVTPAGAEIALYRVGNRDKGWALSTGLKDNYLDQIQPILTTRCVACHGCYEAPCQVNLQSYDGVRRGYNPIPIFSSKRIEYTAPTRMEDASTLKEWRNLGFHPIATRKEEAMVNPKPKAAKPPEVRESLLYRFLEESSLRNAEGFPLEALANLQEDYNEKDKRSCVATKSQMAEHFSSLSALDPRKVVSFEDFIEENRFGGMPFGLTRLPDQESKALFNWLENGADGPSENARIEIEKAMNEAPLLQWEAFLNDLSPKAQLTARYLFEHVFSAVVYFEANPGEYFELVRSSTSKGEIKRIVTRLPTDSPGVYPVFYRFKKLTRSIIQKTQNVWRLDETKLAHLKEQFLESHWGRDPIKVPDYTSNNAFANFQQIPASARAHFMQENSRLIVGAMVQGMVCIGSTATYAIADHFWVWFLNPDVDPSVVSPSLGLSRMSILNTNPEKWKPGNKLETEFLTNALKIGAGGQEFFLGLLQKYLDLKRELGWASSEENDKKVAEAILELQKNNVHAENIVQAIQHYFRTIKDIHLYQEAFERQLRLVLQAKGRKGLSLDDLWKGDKDPTYPRGDNPNAWLNVTRHERNTSVQTGPEGGPPQSIWVLSYSNFERLYYNLVAEYMAWGDTAHKMATWRHMSYVRLEGEDLAISLLPLEHREEVRGWFTRGLGGIKDKIFFPLYSVEKMESIPGGIWSAFQIFNKKTLPPRESEETKLESPIAKESYDKLLAELQRRYEPVAAAARVNDKEVDGAQRKWEESLLRELQHQSEDVDNVLFAQLMPNVTYVRVQSPTGKVWIYSLLADRAYKSHNIMLLENPNRDPGGDTLAIYRGFVGAYPELFLDVPAVAREGFPREIARLKTEKISPLFAAGTA